MLASLDRRPYRGAHDRTTSPARRGHPGVRRRTRPRLRTTSSVLPDAGRGHLARRTPPPPPPHGHRRPAASGGYRRHPPPGGGYPPPGPAAATRRRRRRLPAAGGYAAPAVRRPGRLRQQRREDLGPDRALRRRGGASSAAAARLDRPADRAAGQGQRVADGAGARGRGAELPDHLGSIVAIVGCDPRDLQPVGILFFLPIVAWVVVDRLRHHRRRARPTRASSTATR